MSNRIDVAKAALGALEFDADRVEMAVKVLQGHESPTYDYGVKLEELLTPQQLCEQLKISEVTLWRLKPPFIQVSGRKRFVWSEVREFLAQKNTNNRNTIDVPAKTKGSTK